MKKFAFTLNLIEKGKVVQKTHVEEHETPADAMIRARKILAELKRDKIDIMQVDVFVLNHMVSYQ